MAQRSRFVISIAYFSKVSNSAPPWQLSHDSPPPIDHSTRWFVHITELSIMKMSYQRWPRGHSGTSSSVSSRTYRKTSVQKNMIISLQINTFKAILCIHFPYFVVSINIEVYTTRSVFIHPRPKTMALVFIIFYYFSFFIFRHFLCRPRLFWTTETGSDNGPAICQPASVPSWLSRVVCHGGFYSSLVVPIQRPRWAFHLSLRSCSSYFG